ncbi:MAG: hypothetical protein Q4C54_01130 [Clostridia bacterium]|nr:hypothetical protein [Clostridia bacterium]
MKHGYHGNVLLVELIIVILFFSIASVFSLGVFASARQIEASTTSMGEMEQQIQTWSAMLFGREDVEAYLAELGFSADDTAYTMSDGEVNWKATVSREEKPAGVMITTTFTGSDAKSNEASYTTSAYFSKEV